MLKIIIGALVATVLYFGFQSAMWMGGVHDGFASYTPKQDSLLAEIGNTVGEEGLYFLPGWDPNKKPTDEEKKAEMKKRVGKPWAMVFYHKSMMDMEGSYLMKSVLYALISSLLVAMVLFYGAFLSFTSRFLVSISFAAFALFTAVFTGANWWEYPWGWVKTSLIDIAGGWILASIWLAWYVKRPAQSQ
jgi:hypothetical protein